MAAPNICFITLQRSSWRSVTILFILNLAANASFVPPPSGAPDTTSIPFTGEDGQQGDSLCTPCTHMESLGCKCRHYEYIHQQHLREFFNVENCKSLAKIPTFSAECKLGGDNGQNSHYGHHNHSLLRASFSNNPLYSLPTHAFEGFKFLDANNFMSELQISNASLHSIHSQAFHGMNGFFKALDLSNNFLTDMPQALMFLPGLEKLFLGGNRLRMESFEELTAKRLTYNQSNPEILFQDLRVIDLSNNQLIGIPELVFTAPPAWAGLWGEEAVRGAELELGPPRVTNELKELLLHGNPITQDLATFVPLLSKYPRLRKITWPLKTMTCSCSSMAELARNSKSDFNFLAIYISGQDGPFTQWKAVTCDRHSERAFVGKPVGFLSGTEVARHCWDKVMHPASEVSPPLTDLDLTCTSRSGKLSSATSVLYVLMIITGCTMMLYH